MVKITNVFVTRQPAFFNQVVVTVLDSNNKRKRFCIPDGEDVDKIYDHASSLVNNGWKCYPYAYGHGGVGFHLVRPQK